MTDRRDAIAGELERGLAEAVSLFKSLSRDELRTQLYQDGAQWTVQQVLAHFTAIERSMQALFRNILFIRWAYEHARIHEEDIRKVLKKSA